MLEVGFVLYSMSSLGVEWIGGLLSWQGLGGQQVLISKLDYLHFQFMSLTPRYYSTQNPN